MALTSRHIAARFGSVCRKVAIVLIAGVCRWRSTEEVSATIKARSLPQQTAITAGVLTLLFALSLVAAQFGWIGMLVFWLAVIVLVN
jgi:hypothetical protein